MCGKANSGNSRIVDGEEAQKNEFPWLVGLVLRNPDGSVGKIGCGGSIISSKTILTAASCIRLYGDVQYQDMFYVVIAEHDTSANDGEMYRKVCSHSEHPSYTAYNTVDNNDYGILTLCEHLTWSKEVSPVCLPDIDSNYDREKVIAAGWGLLAPDGNPPDKLHKATLYILTEHRCKNVFYNFLTPQMMCAGNQRSKFICSYDYGGPLVVYDRKKKAYILVGISSNSPENCGKRSGKPSVFARVTSALDWIVNNMRGSQCN